MAAANKIGHDVAAKWPLPAATRAATSAHHPERKDPTTTGALPCLNETVNTIFLVAKRSTAVEKC